MSSTITIPIRARYAECDPMGFVHHSVYPVWLEIARTELLRAAGHRYADLEAQGLRIVVARLSLSYHKPARYDDQLQVTAVLTSGAAAGAKLEHDYQIHRGDELLVTATTTLACLDPAGKPIRVPDFLCTK